MNILYINHYAGSPQRQGSGPINARHRPLGSQ